MKKLISILVMLILASCNPQNAFEEYELSYSRSGGYAPTYENFFITNFTGKYFFEGQGKKFSKTVRLTREEKAKLISAIEKNKLNFIQEDHKKYYDYLATTIKVKKNNIIKTDGSGIMPQDRQRWENVVNVFEELIKSKNLRK